MNNKNKIIDYLQLTSAQYDEQLFQTYWSWCQLHGKVPSHIQQLMANTALSKWWYAEYSKLETQFCNAVPFLPKRKDILEHHFYGFTVQINTIYPKALIEAIKLSTKKEELTIIKKMPNYYAN